MRFFPLFVDLKGQTVVVSGAGEHAAAKIRLLLKTDAHIRVFGTRPCAAVLQWHEEGRLILAERLLQWDDVAGARLVYGANADAALDAQAAELGRWAGALTNIVDDLEQSEFLTPAIVDRDPVTVAIGTEGTAPVLARKIKSDLEEMLPADTGRLARIAQFFRAAVARLKQGRNRRELWTRFFFRDGPAAFASGGAAAAVGTLHALLAEISAGGSRAGRVAFISAAQDDPDLLTLKARKVLQHADAVFFDGGVPRSILELARREAVFVEWRDNNPVPADIARTAADGGTVVHLASDAAANIHAFAREIAALDAAGIAWEILPGVTAPVVSSPGIVRFAEAEQNPQQHNTVLKTGAPHSNARRSDAENARTEAA